MGVRSVLESPDDSSHALVRRRCDVVEIRRALKAKLSQLPSSKINAACEALLEAKLPNKGARM